MDLTKYIEFFYCQNEAFWQNIMFKSNKTARSYDKKNFSNLIVLLPYLLKPLGYFQLNTMVWEI